MRDRAMHIAGLKSQDYPLILYLDIIMYCSDCREVYTVHLSIGLYIVYTMGESVHIMAVESPFR